MNLPKHLKGTEWETAAEWYKAGITDTSEYIDHQLKYSRGRLLKELVEEVEGMRLEWDNPSVPDAGHEDINNSSEMYKCGYFDAIQRIIKVLESYETK